MARLSARRASGLRQGESGRFSLKTPVRIVFAFFVWILPLSLAGKACASSGVRSNTTSTRPSPTATDLMPSALPITLS